MHALRERCDISPRIRACIGNWVVKCHTSRILLLGGKSMLLSYVAFLKMEIQFYRRFISFWSDVWGRP